MENASTRSGVAFARRARSGWARRTLTMWSTCEGLPSLSTPTRSEEDPHPPARHAQAMWDERVERAGKEKLEDADIQRTYKGYIAVSLTSSLPSALTNLMSPHTFVFLA